MNRLLQRYKYLKKGLEEEMKKILKFLKAFEDSERRSLAIYTGLLLAELLIPASVLSSLLRYMYVIRYIVNGIHAMTRDLGARMCACCLSPPFGIVTFLALSCSEVLVKEGLSLDFITLMFQTWLSEKGISHISSALRKAQLESRLMVGGVLVL